MRLILITFCLLYYPTLFAQHLPLQIGNEWHYDWSFIGPGINYAAIAKDTIIINDKTYFEIERRKHDTGELLEITYDRFEDDNRYFRIRSGNEKLLIDFSWFLGHTDTMHYSEDCFYITMFCDVRNIFWFNIPVQSYEFCLGEYCNGWADTLWLLFRTKYAKFFGNLEGNDGVLIGAIIDNTTYGTLHPLPVELITFEFILNGKNVQLFWTTATENNNQGFEVQRLQNPEIEKILKWSFSNQDWEAIGYVVGNGTSTEFNHYSFLDENVNNGTYLYRLKQIDFDGSFEYSNVIEVEVNVENPKDFYLFQNYPNPFNPETNIDYTIPEETLVIISLYDVTGRKIKELVNETKQPGYYTLKLKGGELSSGIYFYRLITSSKYTAVKKFILIK